MDNKCRNCRNFRPVSKMGNNMEAGMEISPNISFGRGRCTLNNKDCRSGDICGCEGFAGR